MSTLGRVAQEAGRRAEALLEVLDEATREQVTEGAFDEIFVGRTPILMGVEPESLCWVLGELADSRDGATWAAKFARFGSLEHVITDAGSGLAKGLGLTNESRPQPLEHTLDVFHTLREGSRAWRMTESRVWKLDAQAEKLWKPLERLRRQGQSLQGRTQTAHAAPRQSQATRGWWLIATVRYRRDPAFREAVASVRGVLRGCWRASSLVEGINRVVRMQQARHRKRTPGLLNLKRLYWNCRRFRTGRRRGRSPYELLALALPAESWWKLLKMTPDQLRQELSTLQVAP